ncbi:GHKL domain-containing protein [Salmonella enterica]|nr:GHKL domain-containing protein [Salmonella enterica]
MKPEDFRTDNKRPLTGEEYLKSLQDGREIYIYGERVKDVTTHPAFRNAAASVAQLYDALHKPSMQDTLCWNTDTGSGGYTHKFFRVAKSADDLRQQRDAIAEWSRLSYGWMGRTPDYKAAFGCALGANPAFYGQFEQNARNWYTRIQETGLYFNHAIVNPPIDRHKPADEVKDVYIKLEKETDAGIIVSGAKVVATNSALTHYNMIGFGSAQVMGENPDFALMFVAPMDAEGVKLISRASYEMVAGATGSPFDYPLSSRFDENDAILVMDKVLIPWENVLIYRDFDRCRRWTMEGGFARMYPLQACVRLAVKLDFITALLKKSLECTGTVEFRGVQADLGEVVAWRNMFWALSDSMCSEATPWVNGAWLPDHAALQTYRVMAPMAYAKIKNILFLARAEHQNIAVKKQPVSLNALVENMLDYLSPLAEEKRICFINQCQGTVWADEILLQRVLSNLLTNAIRYSDENAVIRIESAYDDNVAEIRVANPGSHPADADKLFRRFWRGDNARHTAGFGLGLSLVNAIALLHGGSASYRYADEHNIFSVRLPDSGDS